MARPTEAILRWLREHPNEQPWHGIASVRGDGGKVVTKRRKDNAENVVTGMDWLVKAM